ncbi:MAG: NUDIX domain-containing protein [Thermomicrobiales bacterium]
MGYIQGLRAMVGQRTLVLAGTLAVIRDGQGRVLLMRRSDFGYWSLPGGAIEIGQSATETLEREVREETGLEVIRATPFALYTNPRDSVTYPNGDQVQLFALTFLVEEWSGEPRADGDESLEVAFFPTDQLPEFHPPHRQTLIDVQTYLANGQFILD